MEAQLQAAEAALVDKGPPKLYMRALRRRLRALRAGAAPGGSGWRNSHVLIMAEDAQGGGWLLEWCKLWAAGKVPPTVAELWSRGVLVPLKRPDGKIRPIALTEALVKVAESSVVDAVFPCLRDHFARKQFSVREPAGAELVVGCVRQWAVQKPDEVVVATDLSIAYGCVSRARTLRAVIKACPQLLGALLC